ncbi:hybrid sensor histidine kinase/response regulator [Waterburya agarophytonicola K14]|uniref:histidine kinase n=1 Tax=Waterburya agarophytonicola KI4 TaxID=2874699 RepID=A0A964BR75_9CYAN|nr:ATP-binding protein [Waterburya agarophytonicola]MCC0176701.1 hybrid sensor histidine kinase/response regulator [Waterburya agarophytonicola KI4]
MNDRKILLLVEHQQNRQLLAQSLEQYYQVLVPRAGEDFNLVGEQMLTQEFDLCFIDYTAIHHLREKMLARRETAIPTFLPFVFLTTIQDIGISTDHLEPLIDDIIYLPIEKVELQTKIRVLLRSRSYSLQLQAAQKELNQNLIKEKKLNKIKSSFVSTVSHELRNPLNSISGMAQILETYGDKLNPDKKTEVLSQLRRNVTKMTNLIDNVLIVTQKDLDKLQFNPQPLNLEIFCRGLIGEIQTAFNNKQTINFIYQGQQEKFSLDGKLLSHVMTNLLTNACKYSPSNSEIDFEISSQTSELIFRIRDRGIGIPAEDIPQLFDSFYRGRNSQSYQGTGLGLAIAKEYVEFHQGTISVESELNVGTTFTVTIPIISSSLE